MKPVATQSLDSLLGVVAPKGAQSDPQRTAVDANMFGDLLGLLMAVQPTPAASGLQIPGTVQVDTNAATDPLTLLMPSGNGQKAQTLQAAIQNLLNPELLQQMGLPQGMNAGQGMQVTAITQNDSAVTLTLTPVADQNKPILLTISKDIFNSIIQQLQNGETPNADAKHEAISPAMLQMLLTKLNTKEVAITNSPLQTPLPQANSPRSDVGQSVGQMDEKTAAIQLLKDLPGSASVVSIVAADNPVLTETEATPVSAKTIKPGVPQMGQLLSVKSDDATVPVAPVAQKEVQTSALLTGQPDCQTNGETIALTLEKGKDTIKTDQFGTLLNTSATTQTATNLKGNAEVSPRSVLQLPENIQDLLKPYGKTVTIKIEPEHLGSATLSLQMQQGALRARVVVESTEAENMIESSLGQLVNQLSKSNIKVDSVDVYVGGQAVADQHSSRQQRQQRQQRTNERFAADKKLMTVASASSMISRYALGAVSGGLNLVV